MSGNRPQILVTGGAGYIGSHTAKELFTAGYEPVVLDDFREGNRWAVRWGPLVELDLADQQGLRNVFRTHHIDAVIHFAGLAYVGESMTAPAEYFRNNLVNTLNLLDAMREAGTKQIVFSSTCATYGEPEHLPIREEHPQRPVNPYGESKLMVERVLAWYERAYGLTWTALRYFNAAGADPGGEIGEEHSPETHLIPLAIAAACGEIPELNIFGTDYETPDGTAVRDYVHVTDIAAAHIRALERLARGRPSVALNLGSGRGHSVREIVAQVERCGQRQVPVRDCARRAGDPAVLVADPARAAQELDWAAPYSSLETVVETAWRWYNRRRSETHGVLARTGV